jgi:integrase
MTRRAAGTGQILKVGNVWKIRYILNGRRIQETAGSRRKDAVDLLIERLGQKAEGRLYTDVVKMVWADLERIILDEHQQHRSYEKVERHVRRHLRRHFGGERVADLQYDRLLQFKHERLSEGASPSTVRYELSLLRTGLVVGRKAGRVKQLPLIPKVHVENTRSGFFEQHQYEALVPHLSERVQPVVTFMYWTGWRRNEVLTRQWRHVDFTHGEIRLDPGETKSGKGRALPFAAVPALVSLLEVQRAYTRAVERRTGQVVPWVFHREGRRIKSIRQTWRTACKKAGLVGMIPHDFRRTAVRNLVRAGVPEKVAMQVTGHRSRSVFERYNIVIDEDVREGLARLVSAHPGQGTPKAHSGVVNS